MIDNHENRGYDMSRGQTRGGEDGEEKARRRDTRLGMVHHLGDYAGGNIRPRTSEISGRNDLIRAMTAIAVVMM